MVMDKEALRQQMDRQMARVGWEVDGTFSEYLALGNAEDLCLLVPTWVSESDHPAYELYDVRRNVSYWVDEVPTPEQAKNLLWEHGKTPADAADAG